MRLAFLSAIACLLAASFVASASDREAPLPQEALMGEWANVTKDGPAIIARFVVSKSGDDWSIEAWFDNGGGHGHEAPMGKVPLALLGDNQQAKSLPYGFATWDEKDHTIHVTLRVEKEEVAAEAFFILKDKSAKVSNLRTQEKFKKK